MIYNWKCDVAIFCLRRLVTQSLCFDFVSRKISDVNIIRFLWTVTKDIGKAEHFRENAPMIEEMSNLDSTNFLLSLVTFFSNFYTQCSSSNSKYLHLCVYSTLCIMLFQIYFLFGQRLHGQKISTQSLFLPCNMFAHLCSSHID